MEHKKTAAQRLAEIAHQQAENSRTGVDLTVGDDPTVDVSWNYRLPDEWVEVRRDRLTGRTTR